MKIRTAFVANSSSSSFILRYENLDVDQIAALEKIFNLRGENRATEFEGWTIYKKPRDKFIFVTDMDNFDMVDHLAKRAFVSFEELDNYTRNQHGSKYFEHNEDTFDPDKQ
jgi:hypothetical protein